MHHSDRGSQQLALRDTDRPAEAGVQPSVGSVGDACDNAPVSFADITPWDRCAMAETINGLFKAEVIHGRGPWRSAETAEFATPERVDWFNTRRLARADRKHTPAEAEARYHARTEAQAWAA